MDREPAGKCDVCGLSGFSAAAMSITEAGNTCQSCYFKWQERQREQANLAEKEASAAAHRFYRWRLIAVAVVGLIFVIAANWKNCGN
jgi:hypothetical protein